MAANRVKPPATWIKAASNPNRNGNNDNEDDIDDENQTASSAMGTNRNPAAATATATVRIRSPRKMKTQVAKLVYDPLTKLKRAVIVNENEKPALDKELQKKREDLNREVKEIHKMLNEMSKGPTNPTEPLEEEKQEESKLVTKSITNPIERSKTETNIRPLTTRRNRFRQDHTARSKSATTINTDDTSPMPRKKSHNPEETRRYMQEQRKKRKSLQTMLGGEKKNTVDRSQIKKRLEELRKNTLQIVNKNVNKAKKKTAAVTKDNPIAQIPEISNNIAAPLELELDTGRTSVWSEISSKRKTSTERSFDPSPLTENFKKVGLLRKPEIKDHSFNALKDLNMDKENFIIENLTPQLSDGSSCRSKEAIVEEPKKPEEVSERKEVLSDMGRWRYQEQSKKPDTPVSIRKRSNIPELDLEIPEAKLKSRVSVREKSVQVEPPSSATSQPQQKKGELPYWLKPTSVHVYPYNFIMAVRKKLEAIANPPAVASSSPDILSDPSVSCNSKRKSTTNNDKSLSKSAEKSFSRKEKPKASPLSKSFSEVTSNFSSISIEMPHTNTVSSFKLKSDKPKVDAKKPLRFDEDDTTVSSSVFSSPEKKQKLNGVPKKADPVDKEVGALSPLSVENISNMQIKSKMMLKNVTLARGDNFPEQKVESGTTSSRSEGSVDFSQLLDDFNRSLSQVIEVNHQLKTTLVKSHQIFSPEKAKQSPSRGLKADVISTKSVELPEYVSDFEESSNGEGSQRKESNRSHTSSNISEIHTASHKASESEPPALTTASSSTEDAIEEEEESTTQNSDEEVQTQQRSHSSVEQKTFVVSSDEPAYESPQEKSIQEEVLEGSPQKDNMSMNQYSRDSLELSPREEYIKSHINASRGDFQFENSEKSAGPPPSYKPTSKSQDTASRSQSNFMDSTLDSEFVRVFNKSDFEISVMSSNRSLSESTINYSSIGLYEQLIQSETSKSEHLAALLKMREKAIIDRTKGQIAWLEVQKERYKTKGLTLQISAVKKKQRGILLKMEKEREEIKKLLQQTKVQRDHKLRIPEIRPFSDVTLLHQRRTGVQTSAVSQTAASVYQHHHHHHQQQQQQQQQQHKQHQAQWSSRSKSSPIVRGYELETSRSLEQLLQKREEDLRRRREHVERLMEWHRRLDQEEAEVLQLERMLLNCNNAQTHQEVPKEDEKPSQTKMERKLKEIDKSLRELNSITSTDGSTDVGNGGDCVRTSGSKLNKLWRRLTSQRIEKFDPNKRYKLCKSDLEQLYEDAKLAVLHDFGENAGQMEVLLAQTSTSTQQSTISGEVPRLNLNFSSGQSDVDVVQGNYSPCAAQKVFLGFAGTSTSSKEGLSEESERREDESLSKRRVSRSNSSPSLSSLPEIPSGSGNKFSESLANVTSLPKDIESTSDHKSQHTHSEEGDEGANKSENDVSSQEMTSKSVQTSSADNTLVAASSNKSVSSQISYIDHATQASSDSVSVSEEETFGEACSKSGITATSVSANLPSEKTESQPAKTASCSNNNSRCNRTDASEIASVSGVVSKSGDSRASSILTANISNDNHKQSEVRSSSSGNSKYDPTSLPESIAEAILTASAKTDLISQVNSLSNAKTESCHSVSGDSISMGSTNNTDISEANSNAKNSTLSAGQETGNDVQAEPQQSHSSQNRFHRHMDPAQNTKANDISSIQSLNSESFVQSLVKSATCPSNEAISSERISEAQSADSSSASIQSELSRKKQSEEMPTSKPELLASQSETNDETWTTLRSIKSLDNSTNSKHSSNSTPHLISSCQEEVLSIDSRLPYEPRASATSSSVEVSAGEIQNDGKESASQVFSYDRNSADTIHTYSSAFESSNQVRSSVIMSTNEAASQKEESGTLSNVFYESDFTEAEETNIDDISLPKFETTADDEELNESQQNFSESPSPSRRTELENRLIDLDGSLKDLNATFEKALSPEKSLSPPRDEGSSRCQSQKTKESSDSALMPDVINEIELRRRQQVMLENEMKQFEPPVPYMYVREIPNKPPPPYVPPAHGSPMTTIFPSEERIRDITYRRTSELYYEMLNIDTTDEHGKKPPSLMDENITNIYERIILDICKEYLTEYESVLTSADPNNFHSPLAFFNPPDRLKCMQDFIYKEVRKSLAMDKNAPKRSQVYSVYGHRGKRDHIGEIIIQEMFEEDDRWCNFYVEEAEVLDLIIDEMIGGAVRDIAMEVLETETPNSSPAVADVAESSTPEVPANRST